jgi:NAD(P)-dependent dehydrogenase (short-subunit alcohol dehydrogenase family)
MNTLNDRVAVVVGATSGIGAATSALFAAEGARVVIAGRRRAQGQEVAERLDSEAFFVQTDVTQEQQVEALVAQVLVRCGRLDVMVNCAGEGGAAETVTTVDLDGLDRTLAVHLKGVLAGMKHAAPQMIAQRSGSIINISSIGGRIAGWTALGYSAAKAAVTQVTRCAAVELGQAGVRANSISPGPIPTGIFGKTAGMDAGTADQTAAHTLTSLFADALQDHQPMRGVASPDDIAAAALWLASDGSRFVTGHDLIVDGGISAGRPAWFSDESASNWLRRWPRPHDEPDHADVRAAD